MQNPMGRIESLAASGTWKVPGTIELIEAHEISVTIELTNGSSVDADQTINIYYSPDAKAINTVAYATWTMTYSAGNRVCKTVPIDPPRHGHLTIEVVNGSSADALSNLAAWYEISDKA